jgi:hypothetical protein
MKPMPYKLDLFLLMELLFKLALIAGMIFSLGLMALAPTMALAVASFFGFRAAFWVWCLAYAWVCLGLGGLVYCVIRAAVQG